MKFSTVTVTLLLLACAHASAFADEVVSARTKLSAMRIPYSRDSLVKAIATSDVKAVDLLLKGGIDPNFSTSFQQPVYLHLVQGLSARDAEIVRREMTSGPFGRTQMTQVSNDTRMRHAELADVASLDGTPLMLAASLCNSEMVSRLIASKADLEATASSRGAPPRATPLSLAVASVCLPATAMLIQAGAKVDAGPSSTSSPYVRNGLAGASAMVSMRSSKYREPAMKIIDLLAANGLYEQAVSYYKKQFSKGR
jgi:hypothetical protein